MTLRSIPLRSMVDYRRASPAQRSEFFRLLLDQLGFDTRNALDHLSTTIAALRARYDETGEVRAVSDAGRCIGYLWIERRARTLHIHGILLLPEARGRGYGTRILQDLEAEFADRADAIEWGVQERNPRAIRFYRRHDFHPVDGETATGFHVLRKTLRI